ncbi:MAG: SNF2-related protein [Opitutaceae bacterium]
MNEPAALHLKLLLPPHLARVAPRDAIPVKVELVRGPGLVIRPESADESVFAGLGDAERSALFAIAGWCGGTPATFIQLTRHQLFQLLGLLRDQQTFFWVNKPLEPILWQDGALAAVSDHLPPPDRSGPGNGPPASRSADDTAPVPRPARPALPSSGDPPSIDGSEHYLSVRLPDRGFFGYGELRELLERSGFRLETSNRRWWLRDRHKTLNFLGQYWTVLETHYSADFTENFRKNTSHLRRAELSCRASEDAEGFRLHLEVDAGAGSSKSVQAALTAGRHYLENEGSVFLVDPERIKQIRDVQQALSGDRSRPFMPSSTHRVSPARLAQVEELLETINPNFSPPEAWKARSAPLRLLSKLSPAPVPRHAANLLRPYQAIGTAWLHHLHRSGLGGILADDMGLGKTVEALAFLASILTPQKQSDLSAGALIVCPASLLENWRREASRFFPELTVFVHHGSQRLVTPRDALRPDLIVTSYGTLVRDRDLFSAVSWTTIVADEAQHAKNRRSLNAQALFGLRSASRFVLTGTPVENSLDDLRTLLEFVLPGAAPSPPPQSRGEDKRWYDAQLAGFAGPYILRRAKNDVAPELPEKIEQTVYCDLEPAQRDLYQRFSHEGQRELEALESSGASEGAVRTHVFKLLLRLRQICCDPRLIERGRPAAESAKLAAFRELLDEAMDAGHRILLFSQFVSILDLLREELDADAIPYAYLDGKTRNRQAEVDRFNEDSSLPLFLISLRAGGTGLNLTGADTVVHFDPWWNPAVEAQATDRAHRIGQTRVVTSYRLIAAGTVEERVLELQEGKRRMLEQVFDASDASTARLDLSDLRSLLETE